MPAAIVTGAAGAIESVIPPDATIGTLRPSAARGRVGRRWLAVVL